MPALTDARNAVWDAIENWTDLQSGGTSVFIRRYKFNGDSGSELGPVYDQLPALALEYGASPVTEVKNRIYEYDQSFVLKMWTADWNYDTAEQYELDIIKALFQSASTPGGTSYIRAATGFEVQNPFSFSHERIRLKATGGSTDNNAKAIETTVTFMLRVRFQAMA